MEAVKQAFPEAVTDTSKNLIEQLQQWIAAEPMVRKSVKQIENETAFIVDQYNSQNESINSLFTKIELILRGRILVLRQIAANMQLIALLTKGELTVGEFTDSKSLTKKYPVFAESWLQLDKNILSEKEEAAAPTGFFDRLKSLSRWKPTPAASAEARKQLLIQSAQNNIIKLSDSLNVKEGVKNCT